MNYVKNIKKSIKIKIISCMVALVAMTGSPANACSKKATIFDYREVSIKSELFDVMPLVQKGHEDKRIVKTHFSRKKHVFELAKFPGLIFKAKSTRPLKSFAQMQEENRTLQTILDAHHLNLLSIPHKEYLSVIDQNKKTWYVTIEEKGELAASGAEGQQEIWDSLREKAKSDEQTAFYLNNLVAQLTTFTCLSCITDITLINFSFLKNGKMMIVDTDQNSKCDTGLNAKDLTSKSSIFEGLATLMFLVHEDYFDIIINQAAFMLQVRTEVIMNCLSEYLEHDLKKKLAHVHIKDRQSMDELKVAIKKAKPFHELRLSFMHILKDLDATTKSKSIKALKDNTQETFKTIFDVATSKPMADVVKNILLRR
jgi:hypothetical protein